MTRIAIPYARPIRLTPVNLPAGVFASHVLKWPGDPAQPDPFATGVAADTRRFPKWEYHEPTEGDFHWDDDFFSAPYGYYCNVDFAVDTWHTNGKKIMLCLDARSRPGWTDVDDDTAWSAWVTAAVTRWQPEYIEFINEPSGLGLDMSWVVRMFSLGKTAAKAVKSDIIIVGPSCESISNPGDGVAFTVDFLNAGGDAHIDALGIHLYPHGLANHEPASLIEQMAYLRSQIDGLWSGPIYNTEAGCAPEIFYTQSRETQLRWFWQSNMLPALLGCKKSFWYAWGEDNYGPYQSAYLDDIRDLWDVIKTFDATTAHWKMLPDGKLRVVRFDGEVFEY